MADSVQIWGPGARFQDAAGNPIAGGSIEFYDAGTTNPKTVHSDADLQNALGPVVYLDSGGAPIAGHDDPTKVMVYVGTDPYKVVIKDSAGVVVETKDNIAGAFNSSAILETLILIPETKVETLTGDKLLTIQDSGSLKNCNPTGGTFSVTLPDATVLNNGARFGVRMAGTANAIIIKSGGGQSIARAGISSTSFALTRFGETVWVVADGGNWVEDTYVPPLHNTVGVIVIADRLATPPGSPDAGERYILTSGPTGAWASFLEHDIVEADGSGGWFRLTPATDCGWIAYVQDEDEFYAFIGSAWAQLITRPASQSDQKTGTTLLKAVTPGVQHHHPSAAKFWAYVTVSAGVPTLKASYNVASITDAGQGRLAVTLGTAFSSADWCCIATTERTTTATNDNNNGQVVQVRRSSQAAGSVELDAFAYGFASSSVPLNDPAAWHIMGMGDH